VLEVFHAGVEERLHRTKKRGGEQRKGRNDEDLGEMYAMRGWISVQPRCPIAEGVGVTKFQFKYNITRTILP
jgi:hypothetical protein